MPVPVSATNPGSRGLSAADQSELTTEGPFARLKRVQEQGPSDEDVRTSNAPSAAGGSGAFIPQEAPPSTSEQHQFNPSKHPTIRVDHLNFAYPGLDGRPIPNQPPLIRDLSFELPAGSRCLFVGANGAGKTTFLKLLAGKHMVPPESVQILGQPPFHNTELTTSGELVYVGGNWQRDVAFAGYSVPLAGDFPASKMMDSIPNVDPARKEKLIKVLDVDPEWRMHQVSDGQRRRVQILIGVLRPCKVLLLDEVTVDLDVLGRADLMHFLQEECETRGCTIVYATHIFDGLEFWPTHLAYFARGQLQYLKTADEVPELKQGRLLELVYQMLSIENERTLKERGPRPLEYDPNMEGAVNAFSYAFNNGWVPGTMNSSLSTNAVMR